MVTYPLDCSLNNWDQYCYHTITTALKKRDKNCGCGIEVSVKVQLRAFLQGRRVTLMLGLPLSSTRVKDSPCLQATSQAGLPYYSAHLYYKAQGQRKHGRIVRNCKIGLQTLHQKYFWFVREGENGCIESRVTLIPPILPLFSTF